MARIATFLVMALAAGSALAGELKERERGGRKEGGERERERGRDFGSLSLTASQKPDGV